MLAHTIVLLSFVLLIDAVEKRSGFVQEYLNKNYTSILRQTQFIAMKQVDSKVSCSLECLSEDSCSMTVFNQTNFQCMLYNIYPIVNQELLHDNDIIVSVFQQTIELSTLVSNTNWLMSRMNVTPPTKVVPVQIPRCLVIDIFGYLLTLEAKNSTTYINRYDRTSLTLVQSTPLSMNYTSKGMLSYYNGMIFVSPYYNTISIFDQINFGLLGTIYCGSMLSQPRDIIFIENQRILIIASQNTGSLVFVRYNSPTNYTCLSSMPSVDPQTLLKINETFFYVTSWSTTCIYSYYYYGGVWTSSFFANVTQTLGISGVNGGHLQVDNLGRRWMMVVGYGIVIYDQWGNFLSKWKFGKSPYDIYIANDYRLIVSDYGNSSLTLYEPNIIV